MTRIITPIFFIIAAIGLFFGLIDPTYQDVKRLRADIAQFDEALERARELTAIKEQLLSRYNSFSTEDIERLQKLLPDNVDNVRLVLDLDGIAREHDMRLQKIDVSTDGLSSSGNTVIGPDSSSYRSVVLSFIVSAAYDDLVLFLKDLESSLRIVDMSVVSFGQPVGDKTSYQISITTYWLQ